MPSDVDYNGGIPESAAGDGHLSSLHHLHYANWAEAIMKSNENSFGRRAAADPKLGPWARIPVARPQTPRAQMIATYHKEMMDLVRSVPEAEEEEEERYELSLRDIVELPVKEQKQVPSADDKAEKKKRKGKEKRRHKRKGEGISTAKLLLKAFTPRIPAVLGGHKRAAAGGGGKGKGTKVSPASASDDERSSTNGNCRNHNDRNRRERTSCIVLFHRERTLSMDM
ncbi:hypothetical protein HPP92_005668 [Vanilla planifolia]|uniref:Uncharacterized protein n=1 Tax=Vanilla planifolia TaxID=51239 RepID=A0A835RPZ5_VANPL|nr:hypothetical protein HPP92_005668 [Vanilla planifolia]